MSECSWRLTRHPRDAVSSRLRLRDHDYAGAHTYLVTICIYHRSCLFGEVRDGALYLNAAGVMIDSWWHTIPATYPSVLLDAFVVMPNHVHGVISLGSCPDVLDGGPSLSEVMGWFKTRTGNDYGLGVRELGWPPYDGKLWQSGFYDHIIRTNAALERIRRYIANNPSRWAEDEENPAMIERDAN